MLAGYLTLGMEALAVLGVLLLEPLKQQLEQTRGRLQLHVSTNVPVSRHPEFPPQATDDLCLAL